MKRPAVEDWVYEEWDQFAFGDYKGLSLDEQSRLWQGLYDKCFQDGTWKVNLTSADMVTGSGWYIAMMRGEFGRALGTATSYFSHPGITPELKAGWEYLHIRAMQGVSEVLVGDVLGGCERLGNLLKGENGPRSHVRLSVWSITVGMIEEMDQAAPPDPRIVELVRQILLSYRGKKRIASRAGQAKTYEELQEFLRMVIKAP